MSEASKSWDRVREKAEEARRFPDNTCSASRHLHTMADSLMDEGRDFLIESEPDHCAESMYAVLASLWTLRTENERLRAAIVAKQKEKSYSPYNRVEFESDEAAIEAFVEENQ